MGTKHSSEAGARPRTYSNAGEAGAAVTHNGAGGLAVPGTSAAQGGMGHRGRTRSLGSVTQPNNSHGRPLSIPSGNGASALVSGSPDSDSSTSEDNSNSTGRFLQHSSLPLHLIAVHGFKCPMCEKVVPPEDTECHLVICLTKPRISYNEDVLTEDKGECVICLDDLQQGDTIARLPCLCIYHKQCIDNWFKVNRSCPEHPSD